MNLSKATVVVSALFSLSIFLQTIASLSDSAQNLCAERSERYNSEPSEQKAHLVVLGIAQDAGYPQADCKKSCCSKVWVEKNKRKMVSCIGIRDSETNKAYLLDATPDFRDQLQQLKFYGEEEYRLSGVFITHAHIGHYTGLMHLGREAVNAQMVPTYVMPRMADFINTNGPWDNLVKLNNLEINTLSDNQAIVLSENLSVTPLLVPHRDEYSETVGYVINGPNKKVLFIPDIDKWSKWDKDIVALIAQVDVAFLDGTFYRNGEIWGRDMSQIPHPFITESMQLFDGLSKADKRKINFIHLNHTNPLLDKQSDEYADFIKSGFKIATELQTIEL